jgi:hypothetical protein
MNQPGSRHDDFTPANREARARTINNLKFMALAMHNFAATHGCRFPASAIRAGGQPLLSWRVAILPWLEQDALYQRFHRDEAWNSPHNLSLLGEMPRVYESVAHYQGIAGPGTFFDSWETTKVEDVMSLRSPTLMIVEAADPVPWTKPEDIVYDEDRPLPRFGGHASAGSYVGIADGSVRLLSRTIAPETLRKLIRRGDAGNVGSDEIGPRQDEWSGQDEWRP